MLHRFDQLISLWVPPSSLRGLHFFLPSLLLGGLLTKIRHRCTFLALMALPISNVNLPWSALQGEGVVDKQTKVLISCVNGTTKVLMNGTVTGGSESFADVISGSPKPKRRARIRSDFTSGRPARPSRRRIKVESVYEEGEGKCNVCMFSLSATQEGQK